MIAKLDPLGNHPASDSILTFEFHKLNQEDLLQLPAELVGLPNKPATENASQAIEILRLIYGGAIGYDYSHIRNPDERSWLYEVAETGRFRPPKRAIDKTWLLNRLSQVEAFEVFLNRIFFRNNAPNRTNGVVFSARLSVGSYGLRAH